jgi:nucleotide-binding universal stress UspA family protein
MTYHTILVDLSAGAPPEARLGVARSLAMRFDAALVGLHVMPVFELTAWEGGMSAYIPPEVVEAQRRAGQEANDRARAAFDRACGGDSRAVWRQAEGDPGAVLLRAAYAADLVVTARDDTFEGVEQVVAATGVPVLMLPADPSTDFGRGTVLVAWKASREATRAAHAALPFLREAERVILCAIGDSGGTSDLDDAAAMLERHGVAVRPERVAGTDASAGEILLERAAAHGADLMVMGAYGHSRLREFVLGGATNQVLREATLPVLFGD